MHDPTWRTSPPATGQMWNGVVPTKSPVRFRKGKDSHRFKYTLEDLNTVIPSLGCIVDLSQTKKSRYNTISKITRKQFPMMGAGAKPSITKLHSICQFMTSYIQQHPGKSIAVHCLHGRNRTFCVMSWYLCIFCGYTFQEAHSIFIKDRGPPTRVHLVEYMRNLIKEYQSKIGVSQLRVTPSPPPIQLPYPNHQVAIAQDDTYSESGLSNKTASLTHLPVPFSPFVGAARRQTTFAAGSTKIDTKSQTKQGKIDTLSSVQIN
jgi:hypothetical protein